jgi:hypothetical protein
MEQFTAEVRSLDAARMQALEPHKRYTLAAVLLRTQWSRIIDDMGQMCIRRMMRLHRRGKEALALRHLKHQERTDGLIRTLCGVVTAYRTDGEAYQRLAAIEAVLAGNNYYSFLWRFYASRRPTLFRSWRAIARRPPARTRRWSAQTVHRGH